MDEEETIRLIEATIAKIRPFLNRDGGDIELIGFRDGIVYVTMSGACQGCMMAAADVSEGIEVLIMEEVPGVLAVRLDGRREDMIQDYMKKTQKERLKKIYRNDENGTN